MAENVITLIVEASRAKQEAAAVNAELGKIGTTAATTGTAATASLNNIERATRGAAVSQSQLQQIYQNVVAAQGENSAAAQVLARELGIQTQATERQVVATQSATVATAESTAATEVNAEAQSLSARQTIMYGNAIDKLAGVSVGGARQLGVLAGAFSAAGAGPLILIAGVSLLIGELFKLSKATEDQIELDNKQIELDVRHSQAMHTGTLFTQERATVLHDQNALNAQLKQSVTALNEARAQESIAVSHSNQGMRDAAANYEDTRLKIGAYIYSLVASTGSETESTKARLEATKTLNEQVDARIQFAAEVNKTTAALVAEMHAILGDTDAFKRFVDAMREGVYVQAQLKAGHDAEAAAVRRVADAAAMAGEKTLTHSEMVRRVNADLTRQSEESYILAQQSKTAEANVKAFGETHEKVSHAAEQALREENILFQLRKENYAIDEQLGKHDFEEQRRIIEQEFSDRRKLEHDKAVVRKASADEMKAIDYELVALELKTLDLNIRAEIDYTRKVKEEQIKRLEHQREVREKDTAELVQHLTRQRQVRIEMAAQEQKELDKIERAQRSDRPGRAAAQADEIAKQAAALERVNTAFGRTTRSAHLYELELSAIEKMGDGDIFGGVTTSLEAVGQEFLTTGGLAESMAGAFEGAFSAIIAGTGSFMSVFGKLLLGGMLEILGQMAVQVGTYYFLEGMAALFDPFSTVNAGGLIAGGLALIAFGSGLSAVGAAIKGSAASKSTSGSASASSGASSSASQPAPRDRAQQPTFVNVGSQTATALAGRQQNDFSKIGWKDPNKVEVHFHVDKDGFKAALEGQKVVMATNVGAHRQAVRRGLGLAPA